jgi:hypothetical protein
MIFEIIMLSCFGLSWLFCIFKTLRSKTVRGISPVPYFMILAGFISGTVFKFVTAMDYSLYLYIADGILVFIQIILFFYYRNKALNNTPPDWV